MLAPDNALHDRVAQDAARLGAGPQSLSLMKRAVALAADHPPADAITRMLPLIDGAFNTADCAEGVAAFRAKRTLRFARD